MDGKLAKQLFTMLGAIVTVALVTTLVSGRNRTAEIVRAFGESFAKVLRSAMGNG